jgi:hypothetical protein
LIDSKNWIAEHGRFEHDATATAASLTVTRTGNEFPAAHGNLKQKENIKPMPNEKKPTINTVVLKIRETQDGDKEKFEYDVRVNGRMLKGSTENSEEGMALVEAFLKDQKKIKHLL